MPRPPSTRPRWTPRCSNACPPRGNSWRVNLRLNAEDESLNGEAIDALEAGSELDSRQEASLDVSGPLVKDKLYTFLSAQRSEREDSIVDGLSSTPDDIRFLPIREERTETKLFAKLGFEPTPSNRIALVLGKDDVDTDNRGLDSFTSPEAAQTQESPAFLYNASWQSVIGSRHLLELKVTGFDAEDNRLPLQGATPAIQLLGGNRDLYGNAVFTRKRDLGNDAATLGWSSDLSLGATDHQLKLGIEADRGTWLEQRTRNGGYTWRPEEGDGPFDPNDPATWGFISSDWGGDIRLDAETETRALYLQDYVAIGSRVTLSVGARYGQWQGDLTPGFGGGSSFRAIDADAVAPRAGLVVDLSADASLVGKLHWGRYHQSLFALMFDRTDGADAFQDEEYWDWDAASLPDLATRYSPAQRDLLFVFFGDNPIGSEVGRLEGYDQPYVDQAVIGLEKTFGGRTKVGVTYVNRENDDVIALVDRNLATNYTAIHGVHVRDRDGSPVLDQNGNPLVLDTVYLRNDDILYVGAAPGLSPEQIANLDYDRDLVLTVADDAERRFDQVQLTADHRAERFDFSASLVWTSLEGNFYSVNGYDDPDGVGAGAFVFANEQTNFDGKLTNASEWEAKIRLGADLPWQLRGGFFYRYTVGDRVTPRYQIDRRQHRFYLANGEALDRDLYYSIDGERIFLEPRGNDELEQYSTLDLYLDKTFTLGRLDLVFGLDVFNLLDEDAVTTVKTLVNDQQPSDPTTLYGSPRLRQAPRTLRLNLALRW